MVKAALAAFVALVAVSLTPTAGAAGYQKAYFGATKPGSWAQYVMKVDGQPDMDYLSTRLPDAGGQQRIEIRIQYMAAGKLTEAFTDFVLKQGYSLEADALGFGKALATMSTRTPGTKAYPMPAAALDNARKTMPDYAVSAEFIGTENIGGKVSDRYRYTQRHPGSPAQIETGELWLSDTVPFGLVKQKATNKEESGKVVSQFEMLLVDSGATSAAGQDAAAKRPAATKAAGPMLLADAFRKGQVELAVTVVPGDAGKNLRITFKNKGATPLRLTVPAGPTTLEVGTPLGQLRLQAAAAKSLDIAPGTTSPAVEIAQTGTQRAVAGSFVLSVYEGTPLYSGSVTMDTVKQ
jgi:hypothetical protein